MSITPRTGSVRRKVMLVVLATTFIALLAAGTAMVLYELRAYEGSRVGEIQSLANIIARASAPALAFDDAKTARENLALLKVRPLINSAAIYKPNGAPFATYTVDGVDPQIPPLPGRDGYSIAGDRVQHFQRIVENNEVLGTLYINGKYQPLSRLKDYLSILGAVMLAALALAFVISWWLQGTVTRPILDITDVTREVMLKRDFSLRAKRRTDDEIGELVEAFNAMLSEVGKRSSELEVTNQSLQHEMKERSDAEAALRDADRRKDEFLATLAHELRNPLAPLRNGLEILRAPATDAAATAKAREMMERQLRQMVHLVDDLLDVSRITSGKLAIRKERIELQAVLKSAIETARPYIESRQHVLDVTMPAEPIYLDANATRIAQVMSNLLNNAARYTDPGGRIALDATVSGTDGKTAEIRVSDNGIGIAPDMQGFVFEMFTQVDQSLERKQSGLGVGLSLARQLVQLHNGSITLQSEGAGRGSRFTVRLPVVEGPPPEALAAPAAIGDVAAPAARRILLADDNLDFVNSMAMLLTAMGHDVRVAHNGVEALKAAAAFKPDFAFLDIGMPLMNGYELAQRLRKLPETEATVLTAVSGWGQENDRARARDAGFNHHLVKPVDVEQLEAIIAG